MATSTLYDPIMNALLALLKSATGYNTPSQVFQFYQRGIIPWEMLAQTNNNQPLIRQPALFLYDGVGFGGGTTEYEQRGRSRPVVRVITRTIIIYAQQLSAGGVPGGVTGGPIVATSGAGPVFHPLIEAVEGVFTTTDSQGALTLGGLVSHCWLEGEAWIATSEVDPQGQGMAKLLVKIMVP
jgi:hypothetical protein